MGLLGITMAAVAASAAATSTSMSDFLQQAAIQVPGMVMLVVVVVIFMRYIEGRDRTLGKCIDKNTDTIERASKALGRLEGVLDHLEL